MTTPVTQNELIDKVGGLDEDLSSLKLTDIAIAGTGINFVSGPFTNYTVVGSPTIDSDYIASGFSDNNYLTVTNPLYGSGSRTSFEFCIAFMVTSTSMAGGLVDDGSDFRLNVSVGTGEGAGHIRFRASGVDITSTTLLQFNQKYWLKITYSNSSGYKMLLSTNGGSTWNEEGTSSTTSSSLPQSTFKIGRNNAESYPLNGKIYLEETYSTVNNGAYIWVAAYGSDITKINAVVPTVDQTYNASSANAQSGVAINGAGFLKNTATGSNALTLIGTATSGPNGINIGANSTSDSFGRGTAVGSSAKAAQQCVAVGYYATTNGANAVVIGGCRQNTQSYQQYRPYANSDCVAVGFEAVAGTSYSPSSSNMSTNCISIGSQAVSYGNYAIQIGYGTNSTANTLSVGLSSTLNVQLLNSSGQIPADRLGTLPSADGTYIPVLTITSGVPSIAWVAYTP